MNWTFFAGLGLGAAVGMLVAPKSGAEVRDDIEDFARNSLNREKLNEVLDQGRERLQSAVDQGREQLNAVRDRVQPVVDQARERVQPVVDQAREKMSAVTDRAAEMKDSMVDRAASVKDRVINGGLLAILNEWPHDRLIEIDGIGPVLATKIIQGRPYESSEELLEAKLPPSAIASLKKAA
jgi:gas vesicle protein